jgi:hypothetical protein
MGKPLLYLAGGFYGGWQNGVKAYLGDRFCYYDPRIDADQTTIAAYTMTDFERAKMCDWMLAYYEIDNPSGLGLAAEIGIARTMGRRIIYVDEHPRIHGLLAGLASEVFTDLDSALEWMAQKRDRDSGK